ncbi:MAG: response regulator [Pseudomonadota bacterium]
MVTLLAIDDNEDNLASVSAILKNYIPGCRVITARSGPEGIEKARVESPDTILLDIKMPGMDGYEVCRILKEHETARHIPVIMVSAVMMEARDLVKGLEAGADAYLTKPFDELVLTAQVKTSLRMKHAEDGLRMQKDLLEAMVRERTATLAETNRRLKREIEEREKADASLRESEARFRLLYEKAPLGYQSLDEKGHIIAVNRAWLDLTGYPRDQVIGRWFGDFLAPHEIEGFKERFPKFLGAGEVHVDLDMVRRDGSEIIVHFDGRTGYDEHRQGRQTHCILSDITARKTAEEALRASNEKFHAMVDNIGIGVALISPAMEVLEVNSQLRSWFPDMDLSSSPVCYRTLNNPPRDAACDSCPTLGTLKDGQVHDAIITRPTATGRRHYRIVSSPVLSARGKVSAAIEMVDDITERVVLEARVRQSQKLESIGTLAGGIAHDFNNILSAIIGFTELALDEVDKGSALEDDLLEIFSGGKRAKDLVKQILTFARQSDEQIRPIRIDVITKEILKFIRSSIPKTIDIRSSIRSDSLIMANPTQIHQVFMNLCTNASHAMDADGGTLSIGLHDIEIADPSQIKGMDLKPGQYIELTVADTGTGISPDIMDRIFDPYFTTKGPGEGTGMGLALTHGIVESCGGRIGVSSIPGKGSEFTIYFPVTRKREQTRFHESDPLPTGTESILFVDDEVSITKIGERILGKLGYRITVRTGSLDALELFRANPHDFDLVVTDMTMPGMTGDRLAAELVNIRPDIPVVLCTGYSRKLSDAKNSGDGIRAVVYKPIEKGDLAKIVRNVLDMSESRH